MKPGNGVGLYPTLNEKQSDSTLVNLNQTSGLSNLPADIITSISNFFDPKDLASLSATCRSFSSTWEYGKNIWYPAIENSYPYAKRLIPQEYIASNASSRFFHLLQSMFADSGFQLVRENEYKNIIYKSVQDIEVENKSPREALVVKKNQFNAFLVHKIITGEYKSSNSGSYGLENALDSVNSPDGIDEVWLLNEWKDNLSSRDFTRLITEKISYKGRNFYFINELLRLNKEYIFTTFLSSGVDISDLDYSLLNENKSISIYFKTLFKSAIFKKSFWREEFAKYIVISGDVKLLKFILSPVDDHDHEESYWQYHYKFLENLSTLFGKRGINKKIQSCFDFLYNKVYKKTLANCARFDQTIPKSGVISSYKTSDNKTVDKKITEISIAEIKNAVTLALSANKDRFLSSLFDNKNFIKNLSDWSKGDILVLIKDAAKNTNLIILEKLINAANKTFSFSMNSPVIAALVKRNQVLEEFSKICSKGNEQPPLNSNCLGSDNKNGKRKLTYSKGFVEPVNEHGAQRRMI